MKADGVTPTEIAARLGIGRASVYRVLSQLTGVARMATDADMAVNPRSVAA